MIVDVNASLGHWPFRKLPCNTADGMLTLMDRTGVGEAWVAALEGVFYKDVQVANRDLAERCGGSNGRLRPVAVINPKFPGWQDDMRQCVESLGMTGVRLYPNYHAYDLTSPCLADLLTLAAEMRMFVQLAVRTDDERMHHWLMKVPTVNLAPLADLASSRAELPIVVLNATVGEVAHIGDAATGPANVFTEISYIDGMNGIKRLIERVGESRVLFGTHAPYLVAESAHMKVKESELTEAERAKITCENARRILTSVGASGA